MSKQIQVNLAFNAETAKAKQQINDLVNSLNKISTRNSQIFDDKSLKDAASAAKDLTKHLEASVNVNTGKLDLNKFTQSLAQSKTSLTNLYNQLSKAGPEGQKAFSQLSSAIASSDSSVLNLNAKVKDLGQTLKNTVKWQLSSSLVHGFMGAMQHAIGYAKDLNSSLNDIRIVTGASVDEMAKFAEQANKSAKALSATTTEYTKASLIYYQQGLSDAEVKERTDVTIKMANVSKESAVTVSDQMTAVWNNFYDGSKSLEYYADVMTALGAATASSVDEIAGGLEKFAAIGDTIGLSYEYAAAALATITSNTRESEEVVGTALKTIFARIQGLSLGETLDDGTNLNKYSQALEKVGISIFDQAGELKAMDNILAELGGKWQTLSKDQQTALAQTVAGVRQYTQLIALMDNWDSGDSDSFMANLNTAYNSEGALQEQQEIYAQSWEAAADRVTAATEDIYDSLINDEAIVVLLNGLEKILNVIGALVDGFGGLKGILLLVGGIFTKQFANEMPEVIDKLKQNFDILTGKGQEKKVKALEETATARLTTAKSAKMGSAEQIRAQADADQMKAMADLERIHSRLTDAQYNSQKAKIDEARASQELVAALQEEIETNEKVFKQKKREAGTREGSKKVSDRINELDEEIGHTDEDKEAAQELYQATRMKSQGELTIEESEWLHSYEQRMAELETLKQLSGDLTLNQAIASQMDELNKLYTKWAQLNQVADDYQEQLKSFNDRSTAIDKAGGINTEKGKQEFDELTTSMKNYLKILSQIDGMDIDVNGLDKIIGEVELGEKTVQDLIEEFKKLSHVQINVDGQITQIGDEALDATGHMQSLENEIDQVVGALKALSPEQFEKLAEAAREAGIEIAGLKYTKAKQENTNKQNKPVVVEPKMEFSTALTTIAGLGMEVASIFSSLGGIISVCFDEGTTAGEKFIAVLSAMPAILFSIADIMKTVKSGDFISAISTMGTSMTALAGKLPNLFGKVGASAVKMGTNVAASGAAAGTAAGGFSALGGGLLSLLPYIAAVALAIGALIGIIKFIDWAIVTPEEKLEAAEEKAKDLSDSLVEAEAEAQALKTAFNGYDSAVDKLSECTRNTQEWQSALHNVNGEVLALMDKYPSLATMVNESGENAISKDSDTGALKIADWAKDRLIEESEQAVSNVRAASIQANQEVRSARIEVQQKNLSKEINSKKGTIATKITGDEVVDVSSQISSYIAKNAEKFQSMTIDEQKADLSKYFEENNIGGNIDAWVSAIGDTNGSITALIGAINANTAAIQIENQAIVDSALVDSEKVQDSQYGDLITEKIAETDYQAEVDRQRAQLIAKGWGTNWINKATGVNDQARTIFDEYAKAAGITDYDLTDTTGTDANRNFVYTDANGQEITVSLNKMLDVVANQKAQEQIQIDAEGLADQLAQYEVTGKDKKTVDSLLKSGLAGLTEEQKETVQQSGDIRNIISDEAYASMEQAFNVLYGTEGSNKLKSWLESLNQQIANWQPEQFDLDTWKSDYAAKMNIINNLETGDTISPEDYAILGEEYQQYFSEQLDGTYKLIIAANTLRDIVNEIELEELKNNIEKNENVINDVTGAIYKKTGQNSAEINNTVNDWDKVTDEERAKNIIEGEFASTIAEKLDIDLNEYDNYIDKLNAIKEAWNETYSSVIKGKEAMALTAKNMAELDSMELDKDSGAYGEGLKNLASQYEDCQDELDNYLNTLEKYGKESKEAKVASEKLAKSIRKAEWDKFTDDALEAAKALKKATSPKDIEKNLKTIQKAFKDSLGFDASIESLEKYKDKFIEWANAGEEASDDIATQLYSLLQLEENVSNNFAELGDKEITLEVGADTYAAESSFSNLADFYSSVKNIVESNPPIVDAYGNADFSNMIAAMLEAGYTAADVAAALQSIGQTSVDFSAWGSTLPNVNFSDINSIIAFINALNAWKGDIEGTTNAPITAEAIKKTFGGSLPAATGSGGGRHTGGKSSGGGGGGGGSSKEPKHAEKKNDSEKERYHTLQNQLEDLTAEYDALADASDRAFGQDKLDAIDAEIEKTDELIDKQEEYLQAIQSDLPVDKSVMTAYYNDTIGGPAIQFDENGNISNYDQIQDAMFNKYNQMTSLDEDSTEWQVFEKKYEQLEKYIEQYEETYDLLREEEANYQDLLNQRIDLELEKVEYKVEIELAVPENQKEVIEYQLGRIEDDAKKTGETLALLTEQAEMTYDQILINKQGLNDALELSLSAAEITEVMAGNVDVLNDKTFTEDQISAIQDYKDNLLELNEEFDEIRESIEETVLEAFDMWHEKLEEGIEKFDYFGTILESYQSIIDTVGKDTLGISDSLINTLSQASIDNAINEVEATRDAYKALQQAQIDAERELEKAKARGDEQSISFWESTLNEIQQNAEDAHEEMLDSWEEALNKIVEQFEASIQTAVDAFNEAVYQLGGIEALSEEFDRQKEMADMYLDDYQKIYELSKLNRDVNNSIDDTDSLAGKQKLKKLLGEINKLQADGVKMSEYDLEYLQAEYDLRLAEIALEEAQRAKDVVRLSRDNEGNWSYVYTQNTDAVDEAQQKYEDALYAMQDLSSNYIDEISAQLIETSQEMQEALAAIRIEDYASIEEYYEEVERVQEQYQEQLAMQEEELNKAVANNKELYDTDWTNYHNAVGYKISDTEEFATKFSDTLLGTLMNSESDTSNFTNILADATSTLMGELYGAAEQYYTNMAAAMEAAGTTTGTFADDLATNVDQIKEDSEEAATAVEDMAEHMQEQMDNIINKVGEWQRTYGEAMNEIINANLAVIDSFNEMLATLSMDDSTVTVKYDIQNHNSDVFDAERFATGGYTGSWGNTGRLGILDEKELILNKDDTENFIEALKISRSMLNTIDLNAQQASLGLGTLIPTTIKDDIRETLEQVVQITAEFPNATDHNEIQEAFNSLINYSSQYANRK